MIPALASTPPNVRAQFVPLLQKILQNDFPEKWPGFLDITLQLLGANDANSVYAGLQCLLAICRVYRFKGGEKRDEFDKIVEHTFPQLLNIGLKLVDEESLEAAEMLRIVVKSYKHAIYVRHAPRGTRRAYRETTLGLTDGLDYLVRTFTGPSNPPGYYRLVHVVPACGC